ncbi:MAG: family 20 glycosylhydrolase [Clostridia bacterium]|nr:family 20 glycosylhydrolase [Clostridia bacterium]
MELITLQMDLGRQKETVDYIKSFVDFAKKNGYNSILYYMESAVRTEDTAFLDPEKTFTLDEMAEIVAYTEGQGLLAIPGFENLAHMDQFLAKEEYAHLAECRNGQNSRYYVKGNGSCACTSQPDFYPLIDKYVEDVMALFPCKYVHMGMDEIFDFATCPRCQKRMRDEGKTKDDLFVEHILHTHALMQRHGKTMMMWDDIFEQMDVLDRLPRDIILTNWNYAFVGEEPRGHWLNRAKRDWFAYYESLGFRYMFCTMAHQTATTFNTDSFTAYAKRYKPMGALMTCWCHATDFYLGGYPHIALAGREWSEGRTYTREERRALFTEILGSEGAARLLLSIQLPYFFSYFRNNIAEYTEENNYILNGLRLQLEEALEQLMGYYEAAEGLGKDILADSYAFMHHCYTTVKLAEIGTEIFDCYFRASKDFSLPFRKLDTLAAESRRVKEMLDLVWVRQRPGIVSTDGQYEAKYAAIPARYAAVKESALRNAGCAVLIADLMLHCGYGVPRLEILVKYKGEEKQTPVFSGGLKPGIHTMDAGSSFAMYFAIPEGEIEYATVSVYGEGVLFLENLRYRKGNEKKVAATVERVRGSVKDAENVLHNDTRFACLGNDDAVALFNHYELDRDRHTVRITFKDQMDYKIK